jgi:hypothetical protein
MTQWKYFGQNSGCGSIHRIFRCPNNALSFIEDAASIERAFPNSVWRFEEQSLKNLFNERSTGWFHEDDDEITEAEALAIISDWDKTGWPDLPGRY